MRRHIGVEVYEKHEVHYLQVSQVPPLPLSFVVNGFIVLYVIFALVTILAFNLLLLIVILVVDLELQFKFQRSEVVFSTLHQSCANLCLLLSAEMCFA
jgi:hypothetical protein